MPDLVKKWREQHPYLSALEDEINADYNSQKYQYDKQNEQYEQQRKEYEQWVEANQYGPYGDERDRAGTGPNALTPEMEYRRQQATTPNKLTPYQVAMQATMAKVPTAPERRSNDELEERANALSSAARVTRNTRNEQGLRLLSDPNLMYNQGFTQNLRNLSDTEERTSAAATAARDYADTIMAQRNEAEYQKFMKLMQNPDFAENSQMSPDTAARGWTEVSPSLSRYGAVYNRQQARDRMAAGGDPEAESRTAFITDDEAAVYAYIWNTQGAKKANAFYDTYLKSRLDARQAGKSADYLSEYTANNWFAANAASVVMNTASGVGMVDVGLQYMARRFGITSRDAPVNYNTRAGRISQNVQTIRNTTVEAIEKANPNANKKLLGQSINYASFLYQAGMSMADSSLGMVLNLMGVPEAATLALMGGAAGMNAMQDAKSRGASDGQALSFGIASALSEALFEKVSLDLAVNNILGAFGERIGDNSIKTVGQAILKAMGKDPNAHKLASWIMSTLTGAFVEGSEEGFTTLANTLSDRLLMSDKSEIEQRKQVLLAQGVSDKEAGRAALKSWTSELLADVIGGMISGGVMGGSTGFVGQVVRPVLQSYQIARALTDYQNAQQAAPQIRPQQVAPAAPMVQQTPAAPVQQRQLTEREQNPLQFALTKVQNGETVTGRDAKAIIANLQAVQTLWDAGVLAETIRPGAEGRTQIQQAVQALAEQIRAEMPETQQTTERTSQLPVQNQQEAAQDRTEPPMLQETAEERDTPPVPQQETPTPPLPRQMAQEQQERVTTPPVPQNTQEAAQEPTLRLRAQEEQTPRQEQAPLRVKENAPAAQEQQEPLTIRGTNATVGENRQEENYGQGQQTETSAAAGETDFRTRAETAAEGARRSYLDRIERSSGLGRVLQDLRNYRIVRGAESRASEVTRIRNQAEAGNQRDISAQDYGIANGSAEQSAKELDNATASRVLGRNWDRAVAELAREGVTLKAMTGQLKKEDGSQVRAFFSGDGKTIVVQVDHPKLSWNQLLDHEDLHRRIKADKNYRKAVEDALLADKKLQAYLPEIIDRYSRAYAEHAPDLTSDDVIEELLADYRAGFDMLDPLGMNPATARAAKQAAKDIKSTEKTLRKRYETNGGKPAPADVSEDFAEAKNSVEPPYRLGTKAAQAFEDGLNEQARSVYDMFLNVRNASLENTAVMTVGAGKKAHPKRVTIADRFLTAADWNDQVKNDPEFAQAAKNIFSVIPESIRKNARLNDDGTISETEFEKRFKMARSLVQRLVDALPKGVVGSTVELDGKNIQVARGRVTASVGGEEYRRALIAEKRRLYEEGSLPTRAISTLSHDNWGAMGFLATNTKTIASGDFTTFCPQMYFNDGCWYCYRRAALTSGVNNKLTAETVWYAGEILQLRQADIDRLNQVGGLRIQSFGDWMTQYSTMLADMLIDAEKVGLQIKIITKEPSMIDTVALLKEQGLGKSLYFNLSADYTIEKRGKVDNTNTSDALPMNPERPFMKRENEAGEEETWWKRALTVQEANEYRKMYPWVNTRIVATNLDEFIRGLSDPTVDVVTGYHGDIRQQERVSSETGETLLDVEPLGDAGMPRFAYDRKTGEWTLEYEGKSRYQKQLAQRIQEEGLEREYYAKSCCIFGRCAKCQGKCGSYARSFEVKNATNRDQESVKYWQREMESGVDNPLLESQQEGKASTEIDDNRYSLEIVDPVQPVSEKWQRGATYDEVKAAHPTLFELAADEAETRNPTQINGTVKTYRKIYDMLKQEGFDGTILDASSGLGYGTRAGRDEYGYDVDDIEPFPDKSYSPKYTDYSKLKKTYDVVISNAVLNVIPQDLRDAMVVKIGEMLNPGGRAFINVRGTDVKNAKSKIAINEDQMEYFIADSGSYQKGFRQAELVDYLKDALGDGFTVTPNSSFGGVSAVVTKNGGGSASIEIDPEVAAQFSPEAIARRQSNRTKGVKGERKVSRVRSNTYEYSGLYNEVEAQMDEADEENYTYDPVSEKKSMNEALGRLKADFDGEVSRLSEADRQWGGSDLDTAMGILHRYRTEGRATGDYGDFWRWSKVIQEKGTKGGQFIQAFAKYTRTGTGAAMKGAKDIHDRFKLNPAQQKQVDAAKKKLMDGIDGDMNGAAQDAMKQAKGQKEPGKKQDGKVDKKKLDAEVQRRKDAERLVREISKLFEKQQDHGEPVENWLNLTGEELARKIAGRFSEPKQRTKTTMQTILSDLVGFAEEHALPDRKKAEGTKRTAIDIITDYLNNRDAYGTAWAAAQSYLRAAYTDDQEKLDALNSFLTATIAYNAEGSDRTMLDAILQSADVLGISEKRILELTSAGATASTIDRIGDELVNQVKERMGADYDESFTQQLKDAVRRHITGIALQESAEEQRLRLSGMTTGAARQLEINLQKLLTQSRGDKNRAAQSVADYLIRELGIPSSDAAIAADRIAGAFMDELANRADRKLQQMFAAKAPKTQEQRDKLLDLIRLGGLTNSNVEDVVVDALGLGGMSRERQRELVGVMAQFGETLDAMEADDLDGLKDLIRAQAAVRNTPLSRQAEKTLAGETDAEYLREFALAQLDAIAGDFAEMSPGAKISTFQTISHLLNMRTALRNLTSNQVFDLVDSAANNLATIPDMVIGAFTGKRTVGANKSWLSEMKRAGAKQGAARNALEVRLDVSPDDRQKSKYGTAGRRTNSMAASNAFGRILSHLEEVMGYELNSTDEFHKGSVRGETLESLARFVERGDITQEQANAWADEEALYRSFQDDTLVGNIMGELKTLLNVIGFGDSGKKNTRGRTIHDFGLGDLVVKYTQVPGALIHRGIEYSPLGYAKMLYDLAIAKDSLVRTQRRGEDVANAQRKLALDIGRATTGSGLITLFAVLAKAGLLRRDDDDKDKNAKAMHAAQGLSGTQLNLTALKRWIEGGDLSLTDGDVLADIGFLEPLDSLMTIATLMANDDDLKLTDIGVKSLDGVWKAISNTSAMQTISNIISTVQYHDEENDLPLYFQIPIEIASDSISGFVPSPVRQLAQATDTTYRDQYRSKALNDQIRAKVMNSIPGVRQMLAPKITPLGEDKKYQKPLLNYLNATLNPGNINVYQGSSVVDELNRVYGETDDAKIWPERNAPYSFTAKTKPMNDPNAKYTDGSYTLTPDERTQYQRTRGQQTNAIMEDVMGTDWYKAMDPTTQADVLNWIGNFSNYIAKKEMLAGRELDYGSDTYDKYYASLMKGTSPADVVAAAKKKVAEPAKELAAAEVVIAEAKIPEASKEEAETMSADAKRFYAGFLQGGVSDETARKLATELDGSEASGHEQWRIIYDNAGKEGEKAVTSVMTDDMKRNWEIAKTFNVSMDDYIGVREGFIKLNGKKSQTQAEWNATLDNYKFSDNEAEDKRIKGAMWQIVTGSESTKNNPYDKEAGQAVIDTKAKGGSGSGSYAPARVPTLRLPDIPKAEKPSSGLRIRAAAPAAQAPRSGLRLK